MDAPAESRLGQYRAAGPDGHRTGRGIGAPGSQCHRHRRRCLRLWRITTRKWALDTLCEGARLYGGRWNPIAWPVMYAGATIEICALEKFVHLGGAAHPPLVLVSIDVPDDEALVYRPPLADLPPDWADLPAP